MPDPFAQFLDERQIAKADAPAPADDPFSSFMDRAASNKRASLEHSLDHGSQQDPDEKARNLALAKHLSLPVDTIEADPANAARLAKLGMLDIDALRAESPNVAKWLENPNNAAIAHDDLDNLRAIERTARALTPGQPEPDTPELRQAIEMRADQLWQVLDAYRQRVAERAANPLPPEAIGGPVSNEEASDPGRQLSLELGSPQSRDDLINSMRASLRLPDLRPNEGLLTAAARGFGSGVTRMVGGILGNADILDEGRAQEQRHLSKFAASTTGENLVSALTGSVPNLAAMVASRGRTASALATRYGINPAAVSKWMVPAEIAGLSLSQNIQDRNQTPAEALLNAALEGAFTRAGGSFEPFLDAAGTTGGKFLKEVVKEALEEGGTAGSQDIVSQKLGKNTDPYSFLRTLEATGYGAAAGVIFSGAFGIPRAMADRYAQQANAAGSAQDDAELLDQAVDLLKQSKVSQRSPEEVGKLVETTLGQGGAHRFVDASDFQAAFDDPAAVASALGIANEYGTALATDGQMQIPTGRLLQLAATDPKARTLLQRARRAPDAMNASEADEFQARAPDALSQLRNEAKASTAEAQQDTSTTDQQVADIETHLVERLSAVSPGHIDRGAIKDQAKVVAPAFGSLAKRTGKTPQELFTLKLRGDTSRLMRGEQFDITDAMIERVRKQEVPTDREAYGPSLVDFLREKGLSDAAMAGELRSLMESDRSRKPGERNLVREDGRPLDDALAAAVERGYLPEGTSINDLMTALDNEARGDSPTFSTRGGDPQALAAKESLAMLEDAIREAGITDIQGTSNKDIRKALADLEDRQGSETMGQPGKDKDRRANIKFSKGAGLGRTFTINLSKTADVSSFLHESAHLFLEMMGDLAKLPTAEQSLKDDAQAILTWLGAKDFDSITEDQHEQFARGFEAYLFEGKAPTSALRESFARLKAWMVAIYKSIKNLRVELTPEIRAVFDRLVAAEDATDQAEAANGMGALLPPEAFPTLAEWQQYSDAAQASRQASKDRLEGELLAAYQQESDKAWQAQRAEVNSDTAKEIDAQPVYQVMSALQSGTLPDGTTLPDEYQGMKLAKDDLVAQWGDAVLDKLPGPGRKANAGKHIYAVEGGLPVEQVARAWGFPSGDAMIEALIAAPDRDSLIQVETDKRMRALRPDPMTDGSLADRANAALATDQRAELFRRELAALGRRTGQTPAPVEILRQVARDQIARTRAYDLAPDKYRIAAAKAARRVVDATSRQQWDDAYRAKTQEALSLEMYRAARDAKESGEVGRKYLRAFDTLGKRERLGKAGGWEWTVFGPEGEELGSYATDAEAREAWTQQPQGSTYRRTNGYLEQIDAILDGFQLRRASTLSLRRRDAFRSWLDRQQSDGEPVDIDPAVIADLGNRNWNDLSVEEQGAVVDAVRNVEHLAQLKNRLLKSSRERDLDKARDEVIGAIVTNQPKERPDGQFDDIRTGAIGKAAGFFESHRKDSFLARRMDGGKDGGAVWDYLIRSRNDAAGEQEIRSAQESAKLAALFKAWGKNGGAFLADIPGTRMRMTTEQRIALALNWGNQEGRQRVMSWLKRGNHSQSDAQAVLDSLDKADWKLVNGIVGLINGHWSDVAVLEQRTKGIAPEKVQALPFVTKQGVQPGGYYPIKYDPKKSTKAGDLAEMALAREAQKAAGANAQTRRGHTKLRAMKVDDLALRFDFGVIGEHLSEVIHDITHRELTLDQNRLLRDPEISKAIIGRYGRGALDQFVKTATDIAVGEAPARGAADRFMKALRVNNSAATFGFNLTSALINVTGFLPAMTRVSPRFMAQAVARLWQSPDQINNGFTFATQKSKLLRQRHNTFLRETADATRAVQPGGKLATTRAAGYYPMMQVQRLVDTVTWLGAYEQALGKAEADGMAGPEADALAVDIADQTVVDTQGSGRIGDLSGIQRGGELAKLVTTFYSYFSVMANIQGSAIGRVWRDPANAGQWGRLLWDTALVWTLPAILDGLLRSALQGDDRDDEEKWSAETLARQQVAYGLGMIVLAREASGIVENGRRYSGPAGVRGLAAIAEGIGESLDGDLGKQDAKALASLAGVFTGVPSIQINRLIEAIDRDFAEGKDAEGVRRALFGAPKQ